MQITGPFLNKRRKKKKWFLRVSNYQGDDGRWRKRWRPHYKSKGLAKADLARLSGQAQSAGAKVFSREMVADVEAARAIVAETPLAELAAFWRRHHPLQARKALAEHLPAFLADVEQRLGQTEHLVDLRWRCRALCAKFGERDPVMITRREALEYLKPMACPANSPQPYAPRTILNHQLAASNFFNYLVDLGAVEKNPFAGIKRRELPRIEKKEIRFQPAANVERLLRTCEQFDPELVAHEAIQYFAGVRADDEMKSFMGEWVLPQTREVIIPAEAAKTGVREVIGELEENFWAWWKAYGRKGPIRPRNYLDRWRRIRILAAEIDKAKQLELSRLPKMTLIRNAGKLPAWPWNARRRTFCTHHVAKYQSAAKTALILRQRGGTTTLHQSYRGLGINQAQGKKYFKIMPEKRNRRQE